jgi:hypothetical protein
MEGMLTKHKNRLDKIWSEKVKENADFKCEVCGETKYLNSHHYIGRRSMATRWWLPNGICLCPKCHTFGTQSAHQHPEWFRSEMLKIRGNLWLKDLMKRDKVIKTSFESVMSYLKGENKDY